jgi:DNA-nicking Smr family endonuclease
MKTAGKKPRELTDEERLLWRQVTLTTKPLRADAYEDIEAGEGPSPANLYTARPAHPRRAAAEKTVGQKNPAALDRKTRGRLSRGADAIDGVLDLHGMRQAEAHTALRAFLAGAQKRHARFVIVITGKGARPRDRGDELAEPGVLRNVVPHWLATADMRPFVSGYSAASSNHGGTGALYIRIRKPQSRALDNRHGKALR